MIIIRVHNLLKIGSTIFQNSPSNYTQIKVWIAAIHSQLCLCNLCTKYKITALCFSPWQHVNCHLFQYFNINKYILWGNIHHPTDMSHCNASTFKTPYKIPWLLIPNIKINAPFNYQSTKKNLHMLLLSILSVYNIHYYASI
jgi:hypothetical protein